MRGRGPTPQGFFLAHRPARRASLKRNNSHPNRFIWPTARREDFCDEVPVSCDKDAAERVGPNIAQEHDGEASANWRRFGLQFAAEQLMIRTSASVPKHHTAPLRRELR